MIEGRHVKVLGHGCDPAKLGSVEQVRETIAQLVKACGMRVLGLHSYDVEVEIAKLAAKPFEDEGGVTAVGVLSTSHASIHTWPARSFFVLDVYSCRDFDPSKVVAALFASFAKPGQRADVVESRPIAHVVHRPIPVAASAGGAFTTVEHKAGSMLLRVADLSHSLTMPEEWRQLSPDFK